MGECNDTRVPAAGGDMFAVALPPSGRRPGPPSAPPEDDGAGQVEEAAGIVINAAACDTWLAASARPADHKHGA